ncbi:MAG: PQQ-binding-like beta-propeller repeat protein, partial [Candidatus Marinimicrobia bacterium]|nr:PQQ-binding-like beta-propeller repeat protein [Candidatus Neomarinimicrobiota bacterium]
IMYINSNEMAWILRLVKKSRETTTMSSKEMYMNRCAACHRPDMQGTPPEFPSLIDIGKMRSAEDIRTVITEGSGRMPGFPYLSSEAVNAITEYILTGKDITLELSEQPATPIDLDYTHDGYNKFLDPDGYPAVEPPWGTLNALDVNSGEYLWQIPLGEYPDLAEQGNDSTGSENYGGPVVTAGGLVFIGATIYDSKFRAFDKATGNLLWETHLPAPATATPATYEVDGKQFVVTAAGGGKWGAPSGGSYIAFTLGD